MLAAAMSVSGLTACGGKGNETGAATEVTATGGAATQSTAAEAASYPLDTDVLPYLKHFIINAQQCCTVYNHHFSNITYLYVHKKSDYFGRPHLK